MLTEASRCVTICLVLDVLHSLTKLKQHQQDGHRSPHKPLLMLLALGRLAMSDSSAVPWSVAEHALAGLIAEFGQPSRTGRAQSAAYPFTRLRSDGIWELNADVPMDKITPLSERNVTGRLTSPIESALRANPALLLEAARILVTSNFPDTVAPDVLEAVGLDPHSVLSAVITPGESKHEAGATERRRDPGWRAAVLDAWDRQCAFCGYDGQLGGASIGIDAAHVRWWAFDGPNTLDNGLALCQLCRRRHNAHYADLGVMPMLGFPALVAGVGVLCGSA
jgi:putative restriction endonuclease